MGMMLVLVRPILFSNRCHLGNSGCKVCPRSNLLALGCVLRYRCLSYSLFRSLSLYGNFFPALLGCSLLFHPLGLEPRSREKVQKKGGKKKPRFRRCPEGRWLQLDYGSSSDLGSLSVDLKVDLVTLLEELGEFLALEDLTDRRHFGQTAQVVPALLGRRP